MVRCILKEDAAAMELTDEQWQVVEPLISARPRLSRAGVTRSAQSSSSIELSYRDGNKVLAQLA